MPDFWEHLCGCVRTTGVNNTRRTHPVLEESQALIESIIQRYAARSTGELDTAGTAHPTVKIHTSTNEQRTGHRLVMHPTRPPLDVR
jgi:hypothetical protein